MRKRSLVKKPPEIGALTQHDARVALLQAAGLTEHEQARLLSVAVKTAENAMTGAMSVLNAAMEDWAQRLSAARFLAALIGAMPSKTVSTGNSAPQVPITIVLPDYAGPPVRKDVTPQPDLR